MAKFQLARVECKLPDETASRAVLPIADDQMTSSGQLNTDLVFASGFERKLE